MSLLSQALSFDRKARVSSNEARHIVLGKTNKYNRSARKLWNEPHAPLYHRVYYTWTTRHSSCQHELLRPLQVTEGILGYVHKHLCTFHASAWPDIGHIHVISPRTVCSHQHLLRINLRYSHRAHIDMTHMLKTCLSPCGST